MSRQRDRSSVPRAGNRGLVILLLGVLILVQIVAVAAVVVSQHIKTNEALEIHTRQLLQDVIDETRENAEGFLTEAQNAVLLTKGLFASELLSLERTEQLEQYFLEQLAIVPHIDGVFYGTADGSFVFTKRSEEKPDSRFVTKVIEQSTGHRRVYRIWRDVDLAELSRADDATDEYDPRKRPWYERARARQGPVWTDPYIFFTSQIPGLTVASQVADGSGRVVGVVGADVELGAMSEFLAQQQASSIGAAVVVHQNRDVLAYPDPSKLPRPTQGNRFRLAKLDELDALTSKAANTLATTHPDLSTLKETYFTSFLAEGETFRAAFVPFLDQEQWPWIMGVYAPEEHFAGSIRQGQRQSLVLAIFISVLITSVAFFLGPRLMRPLVTLQERAVQDPLTSLLNRRSFMDLGSRALRDVKRKGAALSAIVLDVDHFKSVNDTHGHQVGDQVLTVVAGRIQQGLSESDLIARYGGEEFAVLLPESDITQAANVAERLRGLIADSPISTPVGPVSISISLGVAELSSSIDTIPMLLDAADHCLLQAKREGRDRVKIADS